MLHKSKTMKKVILTGASGSVGFEVMKQLAQKNDVELTVFDQKNFRSKKFFRPFKSKVNIVYGDIRNLNDVNNAVNNQDFIIHLAAIIPPLADDNPKLAEEVNVQGTRNLINACEKLAPNAFFLYSSSVSVYGDRLKKPNIKVGDPLKPSIGDEYAVTKLASEKLIQQSKLNWTIFRLSAIMGAGNHKIGKIIFHMPLKTKLEITTPSDTGRAFANAINHKEELKSKIFNLGGGEKCRASYKEMLSKTYRIVGLGRLDFPDNAFATANFHCGYYADGDDLENILHFRKQTYKDFYDEYRKLTSPLKRMITSLLSPLIKKKLLKLSEPYQAVKNGDKKMMKRFFEKEV